MYYNLCNQASGPFLTLHYFTQRCNICVYVFAHLWRCYYKFQGQKLSQLWDPWVAQRLGWAPAFGPGRDPGDMGSSPTSGSLHGTRFSLCLCLCLSLCLSGINQSIRPWNCDYYITSFPWTVGSFGPRSRSFSSFGFQGPP